MKRNLAVFVLIMGVLSLWVVPVSGDAYTVYINGTAAQLDHEPVLNSEGVYLEISDLFALKGRATAWDSGKGVFVGTLGKSDYLYDPQRNILKCGEKIHYLKQSPLIVRGDTYVCIQECEKALNFTVNVAQAKIDLFGDLVPSPVFDSFPHYEIEAIFSDGKIYGNEKIRLVNLRNRAVQDLLLVLPASAINPESKTKIHSVMFNGLPVEFHQGETHLRVTLPHALAPGTRCSLEISFDTVVPYGPNRLGYTESCAVLTCWYPVIPLDESVPIYSAFGEPYSFKSGFYSIDISVEKGHQVFSGLEQVAKTNEGNTTRYKFSSSLPIREAAFVVGKFSTENRVLGDSKVCYAYNNYHSGVLDYAAKAMELFGRWWGEYPYPALTLVEVPLEGLQGMEYSGMILLSSINRYDSFIVVHEVAHQWWHGLVGNNPETEAWIDEGLANYSTLLFFEEVFGHSNYASRIQAMQQQVGRDFGQLHCSLQDYPGEEEYRKNAYVRGPLVWHHLRQQAGKQELLGFLRSIQDHYRFYHITTEEISFLLQNGFPGLKII